MQYGSETLGDDAAAEHYGHRPSGVEKQEPRALRFAGYFRSLDMPHDSLFRTRIHARHFMQDISVSPRTMDSSVRDIVGQAVLQSKQGEQRVRSIFTSNTLVLLKID